MWLAVQLMLQAVQLTWLAVQSCGQQGSHASSCTWG